MGSSIISAITDPLGSWALDEFYGAVLADPILSDFYGDSGYTNFGYWDAATTTATQACDRLVDELVERLGEIRGAILDVGCGTGGTTARLSEYFDPSTIAAINISPSQLDRATLRVPGASFLNMDAAGMTFPDGCFAGVICVEAAFHFRTRRRFLEEAFRVLEPGGALALSDLILIRGAPTIPWDNHVHDRAQYGDLLLDVGFEQIRIEPALEKTWQGFRLHFSDFITANRQRYGWMASTRALYFTNVTLAAMVRDVILASARKPVDE